MKHLPLRK
jgi:hypothetical protein